MYPRIKIRVGLLLMVGALLLRIVIPGDANAEAIIVAQEGSGGCDLIKGSIDGAEDDIVRVS